jgi:hypothetical protein
MGFFKSLRTRLTSGSWQTGEEIIRQILSIEPRTVTTVTDALTKLTDTYLNLIIEEVYRKEETKIIEEKYTKEEAKMLTRPVRWDYKNPMPKMSTGFFFAITMKENMRVVNKTSLKEHTADVNSSRTEAITKLCKYFMKNYYDMDYNTQMTQEQMKDGGKLYRSKKHKKNKKCKSKRCHKKNIRKTRRRM